VCSSDLPKLLVAAQPDAQSIQLEFMTVLDEENLEDRLAYLGEEVETWDEGEMSFRLLRHSAAAIKHQKYHGLDIITVRVDGSIPT